MTCEKKKKQKKTKKIPSLLYHGIFLISAETKITSNLFTEIPVQKQKLCKIDHK